MIELMRAMGLSATPEGHHGDRAAAAVASHQARLAIDARRDERDVLREADADERRQRLADRLGADERARQKARLAAAVADQHNVVGE